MRRHLAALTCVVMLTVTVSGQDAAPGDAALLQQMRSEGVDRSVAVVGLFDQFVTVIGPRLTGTPEHKRAADFAREKLAAWGMANAKLESWEFGRGWALDKLVVEIVEPRYLPLIAYAEGWPPRRRANRGCAISARPRRTSPRCATSSPAPSSSRSLLSGRSFVKTGCSRPPVTPRFASALRRCRARETPTRPTPARSPR